MSKHFTAPQHASLFCRPAWQRLLFAAGPGLALLLLTWWALA